MTGLVIRASGGSFTEAFVEATLAVILVMLARENTGRVELAAAIATN